MMKLQLQSEASECGLACLAMIASAHGMNIDLVELRHRFTLSIKGASLAQISAHADAMGLAARPLRLEIDELEQLRLPCILHWNLNHFVVLKNVGRGRVTICDPARGERRLPLHEVSKRFTGVALELIPTVAFERSQKLPRVKLSKLTGKVSGLGRSLGQIFLMALVLQLFALAAPLFNQVVMDEVVSTNDKDLLNILVFGFALLLVTQSAIGLMRSWMILRMGQDLNLQWSSNLFTHLLKLPVDFFQKRHLGDVLSRFGSVGAIQRTLTTSVVEAVLDGVMVLAALGMMILYAPQLAVVSVVAVLLYGLLRWIFYTPFREALAERMVVSAKEQSHFLESVRAITPLKLFSRESQRRSRWQNLLVEVQNRDVRTGRMSLAFAAANTLIFGIENLLVFWLGAKLLMSGTNATSVGFTIGMMFAYVSYKSQFVSRVSALIDYLIEIRMLGLHAERLADIALSEPEPYEPTDNKARHLHASIELRNVRFRYGEGEPWVLDDVNLLVKAGENLAIVGPSGCGKSTLLKVLLGLLPPTEGDVLYSEINVRQLGLQNFRRLVGTVMQDDMLLSGSISENIAFFSAEPQQVQIEQCAKIAGIHEDIVKMPMGYQTLVGDMGSSLSGGQKQRIVLARALYKQPKVLALDEATSHLDLANERRFAHAISSMPITRITVAHRPETIALADRVFRLEEGQVVELPHAPAAWAA